MKISGRSVTFAIAGAAIAAVGLAAPATADAPATASAATSGATVTVHHRGDGTQPPAELGNPSEWGVVTFKMDASANSFGPLSEACANSSGGKWCFGWYTTTVGGEPRKYCYSNYVHQTKGHGSTAKMGGGEDYDHAVAGRASNAHVTAGFAYTCSTYYSVD